MRKKLVLVMVLISFFLLVVGCGKQEEKPTEEKEISVSVEVVAASKENLIKELEVTGQTKAGTEVAVAPKGASPVRVKAIHINVGQVVSQGSVLMDLDNTDALNNVRTAEAALEMNQVQLEAAQSNYNRYKQLYDASTISEAEFEQYENALKTAKASLKQAQISLDIHRNTLNDLKVVAPISGQITTVGTEIGQMVSVQTMVANIVNLDKLLVKLNLSENVIANISLGQKVNVEIPAINKTVTGTVKTISPQVDSKTKSYPVEVEMANEDGKILSGMVAKLKLSVGKADNAIVVPVNAVIDDNGLEKVFVVENGVAKQRTVTVGVKNSEQIQILKGIKENEQVVVKGNNLIGDGQKVEIVKDQSTDKPGVK